MEGIQLAPGRRQVWLILAVARGQVMSSMAKLPSCVSMTEYYQQKKYHKTSTHNEAGLEHNEMTYKSKIGE